MPKTATIRTMKEYIMSGVKLFRQTNQTFVEEPGKASVSAFVNAGNGSTMGTDKLTVLCQRIPPGSLTAERKPDGARD